MKHLNLLLLLGILILIPLWNSCVESENGYCSGYPVVPINVVAVAGNGQAVVSWQVSPYDLSVGVGHSVLYPQGGGLGLNCNMNPSYGDCVVGCKFTSCLSGCARLPADSFSCTVKGLTNGKTYAFIVETFSLASNPYCRYNGNSASSSSAPVTPTASSTVP